MKVLVLRPALDDLIAGRIFYDSQQPGVGSYFCDTLFSEIDSLVLHGGIHRVVLGYYRKLARMIDGEVVVFRVLDCRREPAEAL